MLSVMTGLLRKKEAHNLSLGGIEAALLRPVSTTSGKKEYSLFVLLLFFCARFNFNRSLQSKINKRDKECSFPRS